MSVLLAHSRILGKDEFSIFKLDRVFPPARVLIENLYGAPNTFYISGGPDADSVIADPSPVALVGTVTLTSGLTGVTGVATTFLTSLVAGDTVALADGKVLGVVASITSNLILTLVSPWAGSTAGPGVTLYRASPSPKVLGPMDVQAFNLPVGGVATRAYTRIWGVTGPVQFLIEAPDAQITYVRDSKTELFL